MLKQPISLAILEIPLSIDLDLYHILELHCSPLHHILDIVILDLDMLRLVMKRLL